MRKLVALLVLFTACKKESPPPVPKPGESLHQPGPTKCEFILPEGWQVQGKDRPPEKGIDISHGNVTGTIRLVDRPAIADRKSFDARPDRSSSEIQGSSVAESRPTVDGRASYRVQYRYRPLGRGLSEPFDQWEVNVYVPRDAGSCYQMEFAFADKHAESVLPVIDRLLETFRVKR